MPSRTNNMHRESCLQSSASLFDAHIPRDESLSGISSGDSQNTEMHRKVFGPGARQSGSLHAMWIPRPAQGAKYKESLDEVTNTDRVGILRGWKRAASPHVSSTSVIVPTCGKDGWLIQAEDDVLKR